MGVRFETNCKWFPPTRAPAFLSLTSFLAVFLIFLALNATHSLSHTHLHKHNHALIVEPGQICLHIWCPWMHKALAVESAHSHLKVRREGVRTHTHYSSPSRIHSHAHWFVSDNDALSPPPTHILPPLLFSLFYCLHYITVAYSHAYTSRQWLDCT